MPSSHHLAIATFLLLGAVWGGIPLQAQTCGFDAYLQGIVDQHPESAMQALEQEQVAYGQWFRQNGGNPVPTRNDCEVFIIPVVVHVVYANAQANISDAQILSQLQVLNEDYRRMTSTPGDGPGADSRIQFCLASKDTAGNSSTGILRVNSPLGLHKTTDEDQLKALTAWDDQHYLNIWIVESLTLIDPNGQEPPRDILAYASYPTLPNGLPQGVVIDHRYVGTEGTANAPYNGGRTLTHEIGHYLGLFHPFESEGLCSGANADNCLSNGDRVCDTPSQLDPAYGCPIDPGNSCTDRPCDAPDPTFNYLNYTDDACMNAFTPGQVQRMQFFLTGARASLIDPLNLVATGCDSPPIVNAPRAAFSQSAPTTCLNGSVTFSEETDGCADAFEWAFPGGFPASSASASPTVSYAQAGTYPVTLIVHNASGSDTLTKPTAIRASAAVPALGYRQSFEEFVFPPTGWQTDDQDEQGGWTRSSLAARNGQFSAVMPHFQSPSCGDQDILISPPIDMDGKPWELSFFYAYRRRNTDAADVDELRVEVSDTCGAPWLPVFFRTGDALATVSGALSSGPFVPGSSDWERVVIDLSDFQHSSHLRVRFRTFGRNGQNLYLDDIRLNPSTFVGITDEFTQPKVFPNPFSQEITISQPEWAGKEIRVELWDMQGRLVEEALFTLPNDGEIHWHITLNQGLYLLEVQAAGDQYHGLLFRE